MLDSRETVTGKADRTTSPQSSCEPSGKREMLQGKFSIDTEHREPNVKGAFLLQFLGQENHPEPPGSKLRHKEIVTAIWCVVYHPLALLWPCCNLLRQTQ